MGMDKPAALLKLVLIAAFFTCPIGVHVRRSDASAPLRTLSYQQLHERPPHQSKPTTFQKGGDNEEDDVPTAELSRHQLIEIRNRIISSLGLRRVPDVSRANVTEEERAEAYRIYFERIQGTPQEAQQQKLLHRRQHHHQHHHHYHHHHHGHRVLTRDLEQENIKGSSGEEERDEEPLATQQVFSFGTTDVNGVISMDESSASFPLEMSYIANIPRRSNVTSVVLRVYKNVRGNMESSVSFATFQVYQVLSGELIATQRVPVRGEEWETIDLSPLLATWTETQTLRLRVECSDCEFYNLTVVAPPSSASSVNASFSSESSSIHRELTHQNSSTAENATNIALLERITHFSPTLDVRVAVYGTGRNRQKRWDRQRRLGPSSERPSDPIDRFKPSWQGTTDCGKKKRGKCCRHRMYVNFTLLNMEFVVEPRGFEAFYCKGKCPNLYNAAHTHALIQSTMNVLKKAPKPCCAPSKLSNLTIMHYDENSKLKVTDWTNAVVEECACS